MGREEFEKILDQIGLPYRYHHFETPEAVAPPFLAWICGEDNIFYADGKPYFLTQGIDLELYTDQKDFDLEKKVEAVLREHEIGWRKSEDYIETENMYEVLYEIEV